MLDINVIRKHVEDNLEIILEQEFIDVNGIEDESELYFIKHAIEEVTEFRVYPKKNYLDGR